MAAKTDFSEEELRSIVSDYDLGKLQSFMPFEKGSDQTNILLITTRGKFAFRYYEKRSNHYVAFEIDLLEYLAKHEYPAPVPLKNRRNDAISGYNRKSYAIFTFLEGEHSENKENYKQVARAVAKLHLITKGYRPPHYGIRNTFSQATILKDAASNARKISSKKEAASRLAWLNAELDKINLPSDLPIGACRGDTNPTNFLYKNGKLSAVLDFDQASYSYLIYDVANIIGWWMWPDNGALSLNGSRTAIKEYEKIRSLSAQEKYHLYDALKMLNASSIGWFIDNDNEYKMAKSKLEYLNSLGRERFYDSLFKS